MTYYNTANLEGKGLRRRRRMADRQEDLVLAYFIAHPLEEYTPCEILRKVVGIEGAPITSVRRAITNLAKAGKLEKTTVRRQGAYGHLNYCWRLARRG